MEKRLLENALNLCIPKLKNVLRKSAGTYLTLLKDGSGSQGLGNWTKTYLDKNHFLSYETPTFSIFLKCKVCFFDARSDNVLRIAASVTKSKTQLTKKKNKLLTKEGFSQRARTLNKRRRWENSTCVYLCKMPFREQDLLYFALCWYLEVNHATCEENWSLSNRELPPKRMGRVVQSWVKLTQG